MSDKPIEPVELTTAEQVITLALTHPSIGQFENSLKFIQGGTNMTLDKMIVSLRRLCKEMLEEGVKLGIASERKEVGDESKEVPKKPIQD